MKTEEILDKLKEYEDKLTECATTNDFTWIALYSGGVEIIEILIWRLEK